MTDRPAPWWNTIGLGENFTLKIERGAQPPLPWTWEISGEGGKAEGHRSVRGYPSAEEAWSAGRAALAALADLGHGGPRIALTAEQRAEIARKGAAGRRKRP